MYTQVFSQCSSAFGKRCMCVTGSRQKASIGTTEEHLRLMSLGNLHKHILVPALLIGMVDFAKLAILLFYLTNCSTLSECVSE